jgi:hypothetical protein
MTLKIGELLHFVVYFSAVAVDTLNTIMVDLHAIISEAGSKGISFAKLREKSKLQEAPLEDELKRLRSQLLIAGPFKLGSNSFLYYSKGYEPGGESVSRLIEAAIRNSGAKLPTSKQIEGKIKQPFKRSFEDGLSALVGTGRAVKLKGGNSIFLLHIDAARRLFPRLAVGKGEVGTSETPSSLFKDQVAAAYYELKNQQGGLKAVSIGKLRKRLGCSTEVLHQFLLEQAHLRNADLHESSSLELTHEDREGALSVPGRSDPAITVTLRD